MEGFDDFHDKDPLDQLFEDMDDTFLKESVLLQEIDALEQSTRVGDNGAHMFLDPFQDSHKEVKSETTSSGIVRNAKSMLDFSLLPSARRDSFTETPDFGAKDLLPLKTENVPPLLPAISMTNQSSNSVTFSKKKTGKKVGFQVDGKQGTKKKAGKKETPEEKRQRRLARNRESARQSRRRKKQQLENIEQQVVRLALRLNEERQDFFETYFKKRQQARLSYLEQMQHSSEPSQMGDQIKKFDSKFGTEDAHSAQLRQFHFYHACDSLLPQYFRFFLHVVGSCSEDICPRKKVGAEDSRTTQLSAWERFCKDLGLSSAQKEKLRSDLKSLYAPEAASEQAKLFSLVTALQGLKKSFDLRTTVVQAQVKALFEALSPEQVSKLLLFFEKSLDNGDSMNTELSVDNLKNLVEENNINLDEQSRLALNFLETPDDALSMEDLKKMIHIAGR